MVITVYRILSAILPSIYQAQIVKGHDLPDHEMERLTNHTILQNDETSDTKPSHARRASPQASEYSTRIRGSVSHCGDGFSKRILIDPSCYSVHYDIISITKLGRYGNLELPSETTAENDRITANPILELTEGKLSTVHHAMLPRSKLQASGLRI